MAGEKNGGMVGTEEERGDGTVGFVGGRRSGKIEI